MYHGRKKEMTGVLPSHGVYRVAVEAFLSMPSLFLRDPGLPMNAFGNFILPHWVSLRLRHGSRQGVIQTMMRWTWVTEVRHSSSPFPYGRSRRPDGSTDLGTAGGGGTAVCGGTACGEVRGVRSRSISVRSRSAGDRGRSNDGEGLTSEPVVSPAMPGLVRKKVPTREMLAYIFFTCLTLGYGATSA